MARVRDLHDVQSPDEGFYLVPFGFKVNGTTDPVKANFQGDELMTVTRSGPGKWACSLKSKPARVFFGDAKVSTTTDGVDLVAKIDWSSVISGGTFTVRTMTGATETDPADGTLIGGMLVMKKTTRHARRK